MDKKEVILDYLGESEIFCQLAEEAAELGQAALEYITPINREESHQTIVEEVADVTLCLRMLELDCGATADEACEVAEEKVLCQLAGKAAQLSKAALKCRRAYGYSQNVTPVTKEVAHRNLAETAEDVMLCLRMLGLDRGSAADEVREIMNRKVERWYNRLYESVAGNMEVTE